MVSRTLATGLPLEQRAYHQFWRTPQTLAWRPIVAVIAAAGVGFVIALTLGMAAFTIDGLPTNPQDLKMTPAMFLMNNLSLAALIGIAALVSAWLLRQSPRWMSSVVGGLRWRWLLKCVVVVLPIWVVMQGVEVALAWDQMALAQRSHTVPMIVIILATQVFQCAGEEYGFRGVLNRGVAALVPHEAAAFLIGGVVSSLAFMAVHGAGDGWLNLFYFVFGMCACFLTWRTGGLEAAIAIHCVNNLLALGFLPFQDMSGLFDRSAGTGSPLVLINIGVLITATALLTWLARRDGLIVRTAPGLAMLPPPVPYTAWS